MPSLMIHLLTAKKVYADAPALFFLGSVAPDTVSDRETKDKAHFRVADNREEALRKFEMSIEKDDLFQEGTLLHLYLDWLWDMGPMRSYIDGSENGEWFKPYRSEIALASAWLFHHKEWAADVWQQMVNCPIEQYGTTDCATDTEVQTFVCRNQKWHSENDIGPSSAFTPMFIEDFTDCAAKDYFLWRGVVKE